MLSYGDIFRGKKQFIPVIPYYPMVWMVIPYFHENLGAASQRGKLRDHRLQ